MRQLAAIVFFVWSTSIANSQNCEPFRWNAFVHHGEQSWSRDEEIALENGNQVYAIRLSEPLVGEYAKLFMFIEFSPLGCVLRVVSHGSYAYLVDDNGRSYHVDLYEPERHSTLYIGTVPLPYEDVRQDALNVFRADGEGNLMMMEIVPSE